MDIEMAKKIVSHDSHDILAKRLVELYETIQKIDDENKKLRFFAKYVFDSSFHNSEYRTMAADVLKGGK